MVMVLIYMYTDISKISIIIFHDILINRKEQYKGNTEVKTLGGEISKCHLQCGNSRLFGTFSLKYCRKEVTVVFVLLNIFMNDLGNPKV